MLTKRKKVYVSAQKSYSLNLRLSEGLLQKLREMSEKRNIKVTAFARKLLQEGLEKITQEDLEQKLVESYKCLARENAQLLDEFHKIDLEGWEEE